MLQQNRQFGFLQDENQLCWKFSSTQIKWLLNIYVQHIHSLPKGRLHYPIRLAFWVDAEYTAFVWNTKVSLQLHPFTVSAQVFFLPKGKVSGPEKCKTLGLAHWWQTPGKNLPNLSQIFPQVEKHMSCSTNNEGLLIYISYAKTCKSCLNKIRYRKWGRSGPLIRTGWDGNPWNNYT